MTEAINEGKALRSGGRDDIQQEVGADESVDADALEVEDFDTEEA